MTDRPKDKKGGARCHLTNRDVVASFQNDQLGKNCDITWLNSRVASSHRTTAPNGIGSVILFVTMRVL